MTVAYRNKGFITRARHPHMDKNLRQRVMLGYQHVEVIGTCEHCGELLTNLFEYTTTEDGANYCNEDCLEAEFAN